MSIVQIKEKSVQLTGITLGASLSMSNPHELLAIMFEIECKPNILQIEPEKGMLMQGDRKFIKLRLRPQLRSQAEQLEQRHNLLVVRATYYCEYNRKIMEKNRLRGWSKVSKELQEIVLPLALDYSGEVARVKAEGDASLRNSRRMNSFEKFRESSIKKVKNSKMNEDLDFMFRNEQFRQMHSPQRSQVSSQVSHYSPSSYKARSNVVEPLVFRDFEPETHPNILPQSESALPSYTQVGNGQSSMSKLMKMPSTTAAPSNSRAFELIVLAIVAGLFLALGESVGGLFK